jgi:hypothetical protein
MVSISVGGEEISGCGVRCIGQLEVKNSFQVVERALNSFPMGHSRIFAELCKYTNSIGYVRMSSSGQIHK